VGGVMDRASNRCSKKDESEGLGGDTGKSGCVMDLQHLYTGSFWTRGRRGPKRRLVYSEGGLKGEAQGGRNRVSPWVKRDDRKWKYNDLPKN